MYTITTQGSGEVRDKMLEDMVDAASRGEINGELKAGEVVLDEVVAELVGRLVSGEKGVGAVLAKVIIHSGASMCFLSARTKHH